MSFAAKYRLSMTIVAVCLTFMVVGLKNIATHRASDGVAGVGFLFGGVVIGLIAVLMLYYYRSRRFEHKDQQQIAVETLAKLAEQCRKTSK